MVFQIVLQLLLLGQLPEENIHFRHQFIIMLVQLELGQQLQDGILQQLQPIV